MEILWFGTILISILYISIITLFIKGWTRLKIFSPDKIKRETFVSIIIPARNEEKSITNIINDIAEQDYPKDKYELIIIDDSSIDLTFNNAKKVSYDHSNIHIYELPSNTGGKKQAIIEGIKKANGDLIITTDADCRVGRSWVSTIVDFYEAEQPEMIIGPVIFNEEKNIFEKLQSLEFMSLVISGAGAAGINHFIMCNGANMAFNKGSFIKLDDALNLKFASGDDVLFMLKLKKTSPDKIKFLKSQDAIVRTNAQTTFMDFIYQRKRWTSKSRAYKDRDIIITGLIVFATNFALLGLFIGLLFNPSFALPFIYLFAAKSIIDYILLKRGASFFNKQRLINLFFPLQLLYFFYISFMAVFGNFGKYKWKKRTLK